MNRMKKVLSVLLLIVLLLVVAPIAIAEENGELTNEENDTIDEIVDKVTAEEAVAVKRSRTGAQMRILQLEREATRHILTAEKAIGLLEAKEEDVTNLKAILEEMKLVKEEILELEADSETAVKDFVAIKKDLIRLAKEFREIARPLLTGEERSEIIEEVRGNEELQAIMQRVRETNSSYNAEIVRQNYENTNINAEELAQEIRTTRMNAEEIRERVREMVNELSGEEREQAIQQIRERSEERIQEKREMLQEIMEKHAERLSERIQNRIEKIAERANGVNEKLQERLEEQLETADELGERLRGISEKLGRGATRE